jgi:predicted dehydrogenase
LDVTAAPRSNNPQRSKDWSDGKVARILNIGIVGFGKMGILHAGILNALPNSKVTAICETQKMLTRMARKILPTISFYGDVEEMVREERLDAIIIASPIHVHVPIIRAVLECGNGIGLFTEKPLASSGPEALEIAEAVAKRRVVNMVGFQKRFSPVFQYAKRLLESRAIGDVRLFRGYSYVSDIFRQGSGWRFKKGTGGALLELGPHLLDLVLWYFGEPESISAFERSLYSAEVEDYVHAIVGFHSGLVGALDMSWSVRNYRLTETLIEVQGTHGWLVVTDDYVRVQTDKSSKGVVKPGVQTHWKPALNASVDFLLADPEFTSEDKHFLDAVRAHGQAEPNFHAAAKVNRFIDLIHQNAEGR